MLTTKKVLLSLGLLLTLFVLLLLTVVGLKAARTNDITDVFVTGVSAAALLYVLGRGVQALVTGDYGNSK